MALFAFSAFAAALGLLIGLVVSVSAKKQMGRIDAQAIVATMTYACAAVIAAIKRSYFAVCDDPRDTLRRFASLSEPETTITASAGRCSPIPAIAWSAFIDFGPEVLCKRGIIASFSLCSH
jgi:uncharacterized protein YacL